MPIHRLNHAVLYVRDIDTSVEFYDTVLGFEPIHRFPNAAFLRAPGSTNDHDLGLFAIGASASDTSPGKTQVGLYHLAWELDTLGEMVTVRDELASRGALVGASDHGTTKSLYAKDPDGLEFEIVWLIPADLLTDADRDAATTIRKLDLEAEITRFGADTPSGVGVSRPAMA